MLVETRTISIYYDVEQKESYLEVDNYFDTSLLLKIANKNSSDSNSWFRLSVDEAMEFFTKAPALALAEQKRKWLVLATKEEDEEAMEFQDLVTQYNTKC